MLLSDIIFMYSSFRLQKKSKCFFSKLEAMKPGYVVRIQVRYDTGTWIHKIFKIRIQYS